jgi:hypothetical protein
LGVQDARAAQAVREASLSGRLVAANGSQARNVRVAPLVI